MATVAARATLNSSTSVYIDFRVCLYIHLYVNCNGQCLLVLPVQLLGYSLWLAGHWAFDEFLVNFRLTGVMVHTFLVCFQTVWFGSDGFQSIVLDWKWKRHCLTTGCDALTAAHLVVTRVSTSL